MSFSTTDNNNYQTGGYGGGKSAPSIQKPDFNKSVMPDNNYQGGPPQLDLSGLMPKSPAQKVADSQAGGGILKLRQPKQPFNPNPTPNPGFGGGKGITPMPGITPGFGGGKVGLPVERGPFDPYQPGVQDPSLPPGAEFKLFNDTINQVPTKTYGQ